MSTRGTRKSASTRCMPALKAVVEGVRKRRDNTIAKILAAGRRSQKERKRTSAKPLLMKGVFRRPTVEMAIRDDKYPR